MSVSLLRCGSFGLDRLPQTLSTDASAPLTVLGPAKDLLYLGVAPCVNSFEARCGVSRCNHGQRKFKKVVLVEDVRAGAKTRRLRAWARVAFVSTQGYSLCRPSGLKVYTRAGF